MSDILSETYFTETTTRDRSLEFIDSELKYLATKSYKVSGIKEDQVPAKDFPLDLKDGLLTWIETRSKKEEETQILDVGAGEGNLAKDLKGLRRIKVISADIYPPRSDRSENFVKLDANKPLPFADQTFSICICTFVLRYLKDPVQTINEMIRTTKAGGYILLNGVKRVYLESEGQHFFSSNNSLNDHDLIIYNSERWGGGDWILIKVNNPNYRFDFTLDMNKSFTVKNRGEQKMYLPVFGGGENKYETRDIKDLAVFVYQHNKNLKHSVE